MYSKMYASPIHMYLIHLQHKSYRELATNGVGGGEAKPDLQESCKCK